MSAVSQKPYIVAVAACGGLGKRFGNPGGKQLVDIAGKPMMQWSVEALEQSRYIDEICVVCSEEQRDTMLHVLRDVRKPLFTAVSGVERQESTFNGVKIASAHGADIVVIHDGARPLIQAETIDAAIQDFLNHKQDGVICAMPAIDTLKKVDSQRTILNTPPRCDYWCAQTPQIFWTSSLTHAYEVAQKDVYVATDDASLIEHAGGKVRVFPSSRDNIKVTVPEDLLPVRAIMYERIQNKVK